MNKCYENKFADCKKTYNDRLTKIRIQLYGNTGSISALTKPVLFTKAELNGYGHD